MRLIVVASIALGAASLGGCTAQADDDAEATPAPSPTVVETEISTGYTPAPAPVIAASHDADCRAIVGALDTARTALNRYATTAETVGAFTSATASVADPALVPAVAATTAALSTYLSAPQGADAAEKRAWEQQAQSLRDLCA